MHRYCFSLILLAAPILSAADPAEFFEMRVRPVLAKNCHSCHLPRHGRPATRHARAVLQGGKSGPAIVPGDPG